MNAAEDYGASEFIEDLDKLRQILEKKKVMLMIQDKDNDILSLPDKNRSVFYHEATGLRILRVKGKH